MHPTGFNCTSIYPSFSIQVQYYVGLSAQKSTNCYQTPAHVHYQQLHNQSFFKSFKFSALPPPSTSPPPAPWSSYELAGGPTLKVSRSINKPDQALIRPMRHWGQPLRWNLFYLSKCLFVVLDGFWSSGCIGVQRRSFAGEGRTWLPEIPLHMPSSTFSSPCNML